MEADNKKQKQRNDLRKSGKSPEDVVRARGIRETVRVVFLETHTLVQGIQQNGKSNGPNEARNSTLSECLV